MVGSTKLSVKSRNRNVDSVSQLTTIAAQSAMNNIWEREINEHSPPWRSVYKQHYPWIIRKDDVDEAIKYKANYIRKAIPTYQPCPSEMSHIQ